jgi:hypothetical protein
MNKGDNYVPQADQPEPEPRARYLGCWHIDHVRPQRRRTQRLRWLSLCGLNRTQQTEHGRGQRTGIVPLPDERCC